MQVAVSPLKTTRGLTKSQNCSVTVMAVRIKCVFLVSADGHTLQRAVAAALLIGIALKHGLH